MNLKKQFLSKKNLIFFLPAIISLIVIIVGYFFYDYLTMELRAEKEDNLEAVAEMKIKQISDWYKNEITDAEMISKESALIENIKSYKTKTNKVNRNKLIEYLNSLKRLRDMGEILLTDTEGKTIISTDTSSMASEDIPITKILECEKRCTALSTDLYKCIEHKKNHIDFASPVFNERKKIEAVIVLQFDPQTFLFPLMQSWPTKTKTAETFLIRKEKDKVLFLSGLRHKPDAALNLEISLTEINDPAVKAVSGYKGIWEGTDHRGVKIVSYMNHVPGTNWYMVSKIDNEEIFSNVKIVGVVVIVFILMLILFLSIGTAWLYHYRQKKIYKKLWETQEEYKTTLQSIGDAVITTDIKGMVRYLNPVAEQLTGWKVHDALNKKLEEIFKIINEETRNKVENPVQRVLKEGIVIGLANHTMLISKDGKEIPIADSGAPIKNELGETAGVVLVFRDQTEERAATKMLLESEKKYRTLANNALVGIYQTNINGKILFVNEAVVKMLGFSSREELMIGNALMRYKNKKDREILIEKLKAQGMVTNFEFEILTKNNEVKNALLSATLDGDVLSGMLMDITERREAEKRLQRVNECFLSFGLDPVENINRLTSLCGKLLGSTAALYNRLDQGRLCSWGMWNVPEEYNPIDSPEGHICYDVIKKEDEEIFVVRNLLKSKYAKTDPNVEPFQLQTYVGKAVEVVGTHVGSLCVVFQRDFIPSESDKWLISIIASAIGTEEERNQSQKELLKFRLGIERSHEAIFMTDAEGNIIYVNPAFEKIYGYSKKSVIGKTPRILKSGIYSKEVYREFWETLLSKKSVVGEIINKTSDGKLLTIRTSANPIINDSGNILGFLAIHNDISDRKKAEEALALSEANYKHLFENNPHPMWVYDLETLRFLAVNDTAVRKYGYSREEFLSMTLFDIRPDEEKEKLIKNVEESNEELQESHPWKHKLKDGTIIFVDIISHAMKFSEKKARLVIANDITDELKSEEALRESELRFRSITTSANDAIITVNQDGIIQDWNRGARRIFGYEEDEIVGKPLTIIIPENRWLQYFENMDGLASHNEKSIAGKTIELPGQHKNGNVFPIELSVAEWETSKGRFYTGIIRDVTEKKNFEQELIRAKEKAEASDKLKTEFLAQISHEIRSPMNASLSFTNFLREALENQLTPELKEYFDGIESAGKRLIRTVDLLLNISEMHVGTYEPTFTKIALIGDIIKRVKTDYELPIKNKDLAFTFQSDVSEVLINGDKYSIHQIFDNLLDNAVKYTNDGGIAVNIKSDDANGKIKVSIEDTGIGMSKEFMEHMFTPFMQEERGYSRRYEGNGLGLALVKKYCDMNGATIEVKSQKGKGSKFILTLNLIK